MCVHISFQVVIMTGKYLFFYLKTKQIWMPPHPDLINTQLCDYSVIIQIINMRIFTIHLIWHEHINPNTMHAGKCANKLTMFL